ncbi:MAG: acyl-CoA dehydrogenase [Chloroflexi bacterium]|nr:acyl-CoA dehydrogenase [Chloroflexota bacterium]
MDLGYSQEQKMLKQAARDFLSKEAPMAKVRAALETTTGYDHALWKQLASLGWLGLPFRADVGGGDGSIVDLAALYEEFGRALLPSPHLETVVICGGLIQAFAAQEQRKRLLPAIAKGDLVITPLLPKPGLPPGPDSAGMRTRRTDTGWTLNGTADMVTFGDSAEACLCLAKVEGTHQLALFDLAAERPGMSVTERPNITSQRLYTVSFENVHAAPGSLIGQPGMGWKTVQAVLDRAAVLRCAQLTGACARALEMAVDYARTRVQFGQPIGKFQGVQWLAADAAVAAHTASLMTAQAAWAIDAGLPHEREVALAKAYASIAARDGIRAAHEVFAGVAFIAEHDMHLYARHAKFWEISLGEVRHFKERAAQAMGL